MKIKLICILIIIFSLQLKTTNAQDWETAPEVWSEPVLLDSVFNIPYHWLETPSFTKNMDTIYFMDSRIHMSYKLDDKWVEPIKLSDNVNGFEAMRNCSISKDGKRLYMSAWGGYGGWDLWYSDWDVNLKDWAPAQNMGASINSNSNDWLVFEQNKDTIYTIQAWQYPFVYAFDSLLSEWVKIDSFRYHPISGVTMFGISLPENGKKIYFGKRRWEREWGLVLGVTYWDTTQQYWGDAYYLNINTKTVPWQNNTKRGGEYYPWISRDGKVMVFSSNRNVPLHPDSTDNSSNLFISYLLVDENGDSVTSVGENNLELSTSLYLYQNYPNPFNPSTIISYTIRESGNVKLIVYDSIGRRVAILVNEEKSAGKHEIEFTMDKQYLSSGIYYYQLINNNRYIVKKMILTK